MSWWRRKPPKPAIPKYPLPPIVDPPPPSKPAPIEVTEEPGPFGMETIRMKIRKYWSPGE